jgi:hypothetical protein
MAAQLSRRLPALAMVVLVVASPVVVETVAGAWWVPFACGFGVGLLAARARIAIPVGAALGLLGWGVPLLIAQLRYGLGSAAASLSAILGFGHQGGFALALTLLVGLLLGLAGAWLASVARTIALGSLRSRETAPQSPPTAPRRGPS